MCGLLHKDGGQRRAEWAADRGVDAPLGHLNTRLNATISVVGKGEAANSSGDERTAFILFTDIYRSTQLWEEFPQEFRTALERHNTVVEETVLSHGGEIMKNLGDGYIAIFDTADECVRSGVETQCKLSSIPSLPDGSEVLVRVVSHAGPLYPLTTGRGYFGRSLNRCSRICQVCHPGQVLISEPVRLFLNELPQETSVTDQGVHRLRDLGQPEHLYQLEHPKFKVQDFPPLPTLDFRANNLAIQLNAFIGREREAKELEDVITSGKHRLVTITAAGGYGKSRLATQLCANLLDFFEDGVFEVLLAPIGDTERIVTATADALGFQFYGRTDPKQQLNDYLREKEMLLLFDNFEHVIEGKDLLPEILRQAPKVSILVTSREPLRLRAEKVYRLEPLPVGTIHEPSTAIHELPVPDAAELFIDRALLVKHDFSLSEESLALVQKVCQRLDGVPLSIELAAAWTDFFSLPSLLSEVEHQLELTARMTDTEPKHRSIRASLDWSYNLLTDEQREVVRAVSTFKGGFFFKAAEALVLSFEPHPENAPPQISDLHRRLHVVVSELCDKGWLFTRETHGKTRFFIRDAATHQYAFEKLCLGRECIPTKEETARLKPQPTLSEYESRVLAHAKYFAELIEREGERLKGRGQLEAVAILNLELENICEGINTALNRTSADILLPYAKNLSIHTDITSRFLEGVAWYEKMLEMALKVKQDKLETYCRLGLSRMLRRVGKHKEAEEAANMAKALAKSTGDRKVLSDSLNNLGNIAHDQGRYEEAEKLDQESLKINREIGNRHGIATSLNNLGIIAYNLGRYDEAEKLYNESLQAFQEITDRRGISASLNNVAAVARLQGRYEEAGELYSESLKIKREIGDRWGIALSLNNLGNIAHDQGRHEEAVKLLNESLEKFREIGNRFGIAASLSNLGIVADDQQQYEEAEKLFKDSLKIRREIGDRRGIALALNNLGDLFINQERLADTAECLIEGLQVSNEIGAQDMNIIGLITCGHMLVKTGGMQEAAILFLGMKRKAKEISYELQTRERGVIGNGMDAIKRGLTEKELANAESRAKEMKLEELTDFALETLESLTAEDLSKAKDSS